jgi:transposase
MYICLMYLQFNKKKGKNNKVYSSVLLCEKYRENGAVKTRVVMNLSNLPNEVITSLKVAMNKNKGQLIDSEDIKINQSFDFGYAFVVMEMMDRLRINEAIEKAYRGKSALVKLMIIGKVLTRGSKLHIFNWIKPNKFIAEKLAIDTETLKVDDLYFELGELSRGQDIIERKWNLYHKFRHQDIYLYDITSTYFEGSQNELAAFGYNRDGKKGKLQITVGLITNSEGFPLKIQIFEGNVSDSKTVKGQLRTIRESFNAGRIILVGDRGMRIRLNLEEMDNEQKQDIYYISALTDSEIRALLKDQTIQLDLFAKHLVEIQDNGIRYILSCNPQLEQEKGQVRENLKQRFEYEILSVKTAWKKRREQNLKNQKELARGHKNKKRVTCFTEKRIDSFKFRAGESLKRYKMSNFYNINISNDEFTINFLLEEYQKQKQLDGKYIIETTAQKEQMNTEQVRQEYKKLQNVEHAFRDLKTDKLNIGPVYHRNEEQTRGHVFICMFAYAIVKEMETAIYPWLKSYNAKNKCKLSYWDIIDELKNIKMSELEMGYRIKQLKIPELNPIQVQVMKILKLNPCQIIET